MMIELISQNITTNRAVQKESFEEKLNEPGRESNGINEVLQAPQGE